MVQLTSAKIVLAVFLGSASLVSASPECARKYRNSDECVARCRTRFGWGNKGMGTDRWGSVVNPTDKSIDDVVKSACSHSDANEPTGPGPVQAPAADPATIIEAPTSEEPSTSSSIAVPSSSSSEEETTSSVSSTISAAQFVVTTFSSSSPPPRTRFTTSRIQSSSTPAPESTPEPQSEPEKPEPAPEPTTQREPEPEPTPSTPPPPPPPKPTPTPTPQTPPPSGGGGSDLEARFLAAHNTVRDRHGANPLTWSQELVDAAQNWAQRCQFKHSGGAVGPFGENLAAGTSQNYQLEDGIKQWADEVKDYNAANPQFSHFTQMVWKASTQVGCVQVRCPSLDLGGGNKWDNGAYVVCEYNPPGNFAGRFAENVQV